jgi:hypothetical protein
MIEKPLKDKLIDLLKEVISTLKGDTDSDKETVDNKENTENKDDDEGGPIEPELNGGFGGV